MGKRLVELRCQSRPFNGLWYTCKNLIRIHSGSYAEIWKKGTGAWKSYLGLKVDLLALNPAKYPMLWQEYKLFIYFWRRDFALLKPLSFISTDGCRPSCNQYTQSLLFCLFSVLLTPQMKERRLIPFFYSQCKHSHNVYNIPMESFIFVYFGVLGN